MAPQNKRELEQSEEVCKRLKEEIKDGKGSETKEKKDVVQSDVEQDEQQQHKNHTHNNNNNNNNNLDKDDSQKNGCVKGEADGQTAEQDKKAELAGDSINADKVEENSSTQVNGGQPQQPVTSDAKSVETKSEEKKDEIKEEPPKSTDTTTKASSTNGAAEPKKPDSTTKAEAEKAEEPEEEATEGILLICGGANWDMTGRKELPKAAKKPTPNAAARNLWEPHKVSLNGETVRVKGIFSGCNACHSVIVTDKGETMTFGRNDKGQLGLGDTNTRITPEVVEALRGIDIIAAACGRSHTLFLDSDGIVYSCGDNKMGQCGTNQLAVQQITTPTRIAFKENKKVSKVACGAEFSMIVDEDGRLYSFGHPEHGQLGHNSEGKYFTSGNKYAFHCEHAPRRITTFIEKSREGHVTPVHDVKITDIACGTNHTLAVDTMHRCFAWGFAGYHRLGHQETKNELVPRSIRTFEVPPSTGRGAIRVFAGSTYSMALDLNGLLYFWGQNKSSGEATMYPKNVQDLCGWRVRSVSCANRSIFVAAEESCISWGPSPTYGELGYGEGKSKSSTTPSEVRTLDGVHAITVACGFGHTMIMARDRKPEEKALIEKNFKSWP